MRYCPSCGTELPHPPPVACEACGERHWRNAKPCAGALVARDGRLLLVRRAGDPWNGRWDIPGGFCEPDEHPEATAVRETREETGLDVRVTGFLGMWVDTYGDDDVHTLNCYFHAEVAGGAEEADPHEVSELGWFAPDGLPADLAFPHHAGQVVEAWRRSVASF